MNQPRSFLNWIRIGEKYGYPPCCVFQFAQDCLSGREPYRLRGMHPEHRHVPCDKCKADLEKQYMGIHTFNCRGISCTASEKVVEVLGEENCLPMVEYFFSNEPPNSILWVPHEDIMNPNRQNDELPMYTISNSVIDLLIWPLLLGEQKRLVIQLRQERPEIESELRFRPGSDFSFPRQD